MSNEELDLTGRLTKAISSYEARWKTVDKELYDLCHRRPSLDDFADVYTKVAIIGRVYEAGVARAWRGKGDPESEITRVLIEQADLIQKGLQRLENRSFDQQAAADIVELHGHVARAISHRTAGVFLASFVSKYLHFHCPIVPIYDSYAQATIGKLVDWDLVGPIRDALSTLPEWARGLPELRRRIRRPLPARLYRDTSQADCQRTRPLAPAVGVSRLTCQRCAEALQRNDPPTR